MGPASEGTQGKHTDQERLAYLGRVGMSARRVSSGFRNAGWELEVWRSASAGRHPALTLDSLDW